MQYIKTKYFNFVPKRVDNDKQVCYYILVPKEGQKGE